MSTPSRLEVGSLLYLENLELSYSFDQQDRTARVQAEAPLVRTADDTLVTGGFFEVTVQDGRPTDATISADGLSLGGMLYVEDLLLSYQDGQGASDCPSTEDEANLQIWTAQGTFSESDTTVSGCLALKDRHVVGGRLELGDPEGGVSGEQVTLFRDRWDLSGSILVRGQTRPTTFDGFATFTDGGLEDGHLELSHAPLGETLEILNLRVDYTQAPQQRWDEATPDTTWSLAAEVRHDEGVTALSGSAAFKGAEAAGASTTTTTLGGTLHAASFAVSGLPLGPVTLDSFRFTYERLLGEKGSSWVLGGLITTPEGDQFGLSGGATILDGRITDADLTVPRVSIGELELLQDVAFVFESDPDAGTERWFGTAAIPDATSAERGVLEKASVEVVLADGELQSGFVSIGRVRWGGLLRLDDLTLAGARDSGVITWTLDARLTVEGRGQSVVSGEAVLRDGVAESGELHLRDVPLGSLTVIDTLDLTADRTNGVTTWSGALQATSDGTVTTGTGTAVWRGGGLETFALDLVQVPLGEGRTLDGLSVDYDRGRTWAASAALTDTDGTSSLAGSLTFADGGVESGRLAATDLQIGPLDFATFQLRVGEVNSALTAGALEVREQPACAAASSSGTPGGSETVEWAVDATLRTDDGDLTTVAGGATLQQGDWVAGFLCGDGIQVTDMVVLDDVSLAFSSSSDTESWGGGATVVNPDDSEPFKASFAFTSVGGTLQSVDVTAGGIDLGGWLALRTVTLAYDRAADATAWTLDAQLERPGGANGSVSGSLAITDGTITSGTLSIASLPFGDAFTLQSLELTYLARGEAAATPVGPLPLFTTTGCTPGTSPSLTPASGPEQAYFSLSGSVVADGRTFAAGGAVAFADGGLALLDLSAGCLPLGDWRTLEDVRVLYAPGSAYRIGATLRLDDSAPRVEGSATFSEGRLTGGTLTLKDVPLGATRLVEAKLSLGEKADGTSEWGLAVQVEDPDNEGSTLGGGGSLIVDGGTITGGTLSIPTLPLIDVLVVQSVQLGFVRAADGSTLQISGSGTVSTDGDAGTGALAIGLTFADGELLAGSFSADSVALFDAVPLGAFSLAYDGTADRWSGSLTATLDGGAGLAPKIAIGVEIVDGELLSGVFGFDAAGPGDQGPDGVPDPPNAAGAPPRSGSADFTGFPLKALYVRYCGIGSTAAFCADAKDDSWLGRLAIALPTEAAPTVDGTIELVDGRFNSVKVAVEGLKIPVQPGIFLNALRAGFGLDPLMISGGMGLTAGPSGLTVARLDIDLVFRELGDDYQFRLDGRTSIFELPVSVQTYLDLRTSGFLGVGASGKIPILSVLGFDVFAIQGDIEGAVFKANGLANPRTGKPLGSAGAQVGGSVAAKLIGFDLAGVKFVANTIGAAGCAEAGGKSKGVGIYWSDLAYAEIGCAFGRYEIGLPSTSDSSAALLRLAQAGEASATRVVTVAPGQEALMLDVRTTGDAAPDVVLVGPDGTEVTPGQGSLEDPVFGTSAGRQTFFGVDAPAPGEWRIEPQAGSPVITQVIASRPLPDPGLTASVTAAGGGAFDLTYELTEIDGQQVDFIERADGVTAAIGEAAGGSGRLTFTPGGDRRGGEREVVALVSQDGLPRDEVVVATYTAPDASPAGRVREVVAEEVAGGATVTWAPPASDGGRAITAYQVVSSRGDAVVVDADVRSATLPIPAMRPGEEVPVLVYARTGAGLGVPGFTRFPSTQSTDFAYGPASADDAPADAEGPVVIERLAGAGRAETAAKVSEARFSPGVPVAFVATGGDFPDALAGGPAAYELGGPVLLAGDDLPEVTRAELARLEPERIVVLGGSAAIPASVASALEVLAPTVDRLSGPDRFATAAAISAAVYEPGVEVAYVATGGNFPDALAGGAAAAVEGGPVLLSGGDALPAVTRDELARLAPSRVVLLGGVAALSDAVQAEVVALLPDSALERRAGANRFETAALVASASFPTADAAYVATGANFPDALAGVPVAANDAAPLLLVAGDVPVPTAAELGRLRPDRITILGGTAAVPTVVEEALPAAARGG